MEDGAVMKHVIEALAAKEKELAEGFQREWRYPPAAPRDPLRVRARRSWPVFRGGPGPWKKNGKNWFYSEVTFPARRCGVNLRGEPALVFINGWQPFTLWIDGREAFQERHAWMATGPLAEPFPVEIEPGRTYRLVMCIEPTELPNRSVALAVDIQSRRCMELAVDLAASRLQLEMAALLARTLAEKSIVTSAAAKVALESLRRNRWTEVARSLEEMDEALRPLSSAAKALTMHVIGHSHLDMDWMWTWSDTVYCARRDFRSVTGVMADYPEIKFTHSQVPTYEIVRRMDPDVFAAVRRYVRQGRWENAAGTWVEGDLNMADGESIARHMLYARDWGLKHLGSRSRVLWEPDTFGHPGNMPQLARLGGLDCYFHMRCNPGGHDPWPIRIWRGIDGTSIPVFSESYGGPLSPDKVVGKTMLHYRHGRRHAFILFGHGDHGGGLQRTHLELLSRFRERPLVPTIRFSTVSELLAAVRKDEQSLPCNTGETFNLFEGCFTTHATIKRWNRECEGALLTAEALCALAGLAERQTLRKAWTPVLFNQFHDIFDGASVKDSVTHAEARAERSVRAARRLTKKAVRALAGPSGKGRVVTVVNGLGFARSEVVKTRLPAGTAALDDGAGNVVPVQKSGGEYVFVARDLPAFGARSYRALRKARSGTEMDPVGIREENGQTLRIETRNARCSVDRNSGAIGSYYDKRLERELVVYGEPKYLSHAPITRLELALNVFQIIDESPNGMTAWHIHNILREENLLRGAEVALVETGPVFARVRVRHRFRSSTIEEDILFYRDLARIDFEADIDWREQGDANVGVPQLKVAFATGMRAARARAEGPFSVVERAADGMEYSTQKWSDLSGDEFGFALYNDSKYGFDALGGRMRITLLRNSYGPDPESDNGKHRIRFAFVPHAPGLANGELVRGGMSFNRPPVPVLAGKAGAACRGQVVEGAGSVVCTALRCAEHSDGWIMRLFECEGRRRRARVRFASRPRSVREVDFTENPRGGAVRLRDGAATLSFRPFEVKTLLVR